jgi:15-cis-phytoene synthase
MPSTNADLSACVQLMRGGSKSFFAASLLLPKRVRAPATALYAFCRLADDAIDMSSDQALAMRSLQTRLCAIYHGTPQDYAADRALAQVVRTYDLPQEILAALLEGFAWDAQGKQYDTVEDLHTYAARVAGTVGAMMCIIMGTKDSATLARACELGVAMQLTNIARDVGEDARAGRLYLPREWMRDAGINPDVWLREPQFNSALASVIARLLAHADQLYTRADCGVAQLPRDCRPAIRSARLVYAEIGRQLERMGLDAISARAVVSTRRKLMLIARSTAAAVFASSAQTYARPLSEIQFLVDAASKKTHLIPDNRNFYQRTIWVIGLFERLAQQDQATHS